MAAGSGALKQYIVEIIYNTKGVEMANTATNTVEQGAKNSNKNVAKLNVNLKQLLKTALITVIGVKSLTQAIQKVTGAVKDVIKSTIDINDNLEQTAKKLSKTIEGARAHEIALKVMGKTMNEINQSNELKKTYDDLVKLGEAMALPDAAKGKTAVKDLKDAFDNLKVGIRYVGQWTYYYLQQYLKTPLRNLKNAILGDSEALKEKVQNVAKTIARVLAEAYKWGERIVRDIKHIFDAGKKLLNGLDGKAKGTILAMIAIISLVLNKGAMLKALMIGIIALLDDFFTFLEGGETRISEENWQKIIVGFLKIYNIIASVINALGDLVNYLLYITGSNYKIEVELAVIGEDRIEEIAAGLGGSRAPSGGGEKKGTGGVVTQPRRVTVGDAGKEYIIPVKKTGLAKNLVAAAAQELGMTVESFDKANGSLYGGAKGNAGYAYSTTNNTTNGGANINAPATINVYGSEPVATGNQVARVHEQLIMRNLNSALG